MLSTVRIKHANFSVLMLSFRHQKGMPSVGLTAAFPKGFPRKVIGYLVLVNSQLELKNWSVNRSWECVVYAVYVVIWAAAFSTVCHFVRYRNRIKVLLSAV